MALDENASFEELIEGIRDEDARAAELLVRRYEPEIRREVRLRLRGGELRRLLDTMDITQSILGNFFVRAAHGEFVLEEPGQLLALLARMVRNRVVDWSRTLKAQKRDIRKEQALDAFPPDTKAFAGKESPASAQLRAEELLEEFRKRLGPEERIIAEKRAEGWGWAEIAEHLGEKAESLRKRWERARDRVAGEMGLG